MNFKSIFDNTVNFVKDIPSKVKAMPKETKIGIGAAVLTGAGIGVYKTIKNKKNTIEIEVTEETEGTEE